MYSVVGTAVSGGLFGQSSFPVGSEGYQCTGTESSLTSCPYSTSSTCSHHQDAGVICLDSCPTEGAVQLVGGTGNSSGFVQICRNNVWGYVCDYNWCSNDADVLCTQLGYSPNRESRELAKDRLCNMQNLYASNKCTMYFLIMCTCTCMYFSILCCNHWNMCLLKYTYKLLYFHSSIWGNLLDSLYNIHICTCTPILRGQFRYRKP